MKEAYKIPTIDASLRADYQAGRLTLRDVADQIAAAGFKNYIPNDADALRFIGLLPAAVIDEHGLVDCRECPVAGSCVHRECYRRNPRSVGGLGDCPRLDVQ